MSVLKKFGVLFILSLLGVNSSFSQTTEDCGTIRKEIKVKQDPIDFIHNHLLKPSTSNPVDKSPTLYKNLSKKNSRKSASKLKTLSKTDKQREDAMKIVNEQTKVAIQLKTKDKKAVSEVIAKPIEQNTIAEKKTGTTPVNTISIANDLLNSSIIKKPVAPKKDEPSFSSTMMEWVKDKYSCMIDVLPNQISNVMLYRFIDEWYGVRYRMGGTSKKGVDCSAFVQTLYKYVFGLDLLRTACLQFKSSELITNPADLKEGDLVFFKVRSSRISHVGVYLSNNFFVHSASSKGVSIANLTSAYWSRYFAGGGRIKS